MITALEYGAEFRVNDSPPSSKLVHVLNLQWYKKTKVEELPPYFIRFATQTMASNNHCYGLKASGRIFKTLIRNTFSNLLKIEINLLT